MTYIPFRLRVYDALCAALLARFSAELVAVGQPPVPESAFEARHPLLISSENIGTIYVNTERELQAKYWVETGYNYEIQMYAFGTSTPAIQRRVMYMEYAATQVLDADRTLGGILRGMTIGTSDPAPITARNTGHIVDGIILPVRCEPAVRISVPERRY